MVKNLQHLPKPKAPKRLEGGRFNHQSPLDTFVTQHTAQLFNVLVKDGQERATSFLVKELPDWSTDLTYLEMQEKAHQMKVVNDCAERGSSGWRIQLQFDKGRSTKTVCSQACIPPQGTVSSRYKKLWCEADRWLVTDWSGSLLERR